MYYISKDELWKGAIEDYIVPFIHYFYGEYVHLIDWSRKIEFLDKELNNINRPFENRKDVEFYYFIPVNTKEGVWKIKLSR